MKNIKFKFLIALLLFSLFSCTKEGALDVNIDDYPINKYKETEVDNWISKELTDPYNIQVVYRFDRNMTDIGRNIAPANINSVQPLMQAVIDAFIDPYNKVAKEGFGKEYFPKQWVLYGSWSYNYDGTLILGTMSNAKRMTLYGANVVSYTSGPEMDRYMRTIHHEFTHAMNQRIPIPPAFENVTPGDYNNDWTKKNAITARNEGFISTYASANYSEDFAEMISYLVVKGPIWYSNYLAMASPTGQERLESKKAIIREYLLNNFGIELDELIVEVNRQMKERFKLKDPEDITAGFSYQLGLNKVNTITVNHTAAHYTEYGSSAKFDELYAKYRSMIAANSRTVTDIQFSFPTSSTMTLRVNYRNSNGSTAYALYDFNMQVNNSTGQVFFSRKLPEPTSAPYTNGKNAALLPAFEQVLMPFLTNNEFVAEYLPSSIKEGNPLYRTFAGFSVKNNTTLYFYGPVTYK